MKRVVAIAFSCLILLTALRDVATYIVFYVNQDYIAQNLCTNRDKPEVMCYGKCVLNSSLAENHEKKHDKKPIPAQEERIVFVLPQMEVLPKAQSIPHVKKDVVIYSATNYVFQYLNEVFRPPSVLA